MPVPARSTPGPGAISERTLAPHEPVFVAANGDERLFVWLVTRHVVRKIGVGCTDRKHEAKTGRTPVFEGAERCRLLRPNSGFDTA